MSCPYKGKSQIAAYERGKRDRAAGLALEQCPYPGKLIFPDARPSWSASFQNAWSYGWHDGSPSPGPPRQPRQR